MLLLVLACSSFPAPLTLGLDSATPSGAVGPKGVATSPTWTLLGDENQRGFGSAAALGDYDADGDLDLAVGAPNGIYRFRQDGGSFARVGDRNSLDPGYSMVSGDFNGDGYDDLLASEISGSNFALIRFGSAQGLDRETNRNLAEEGVANYGQRVFCLGDVDGDGMDEAAVYSYGSPTRGVLQIYGRNPDANYVPVATTLEGAEGSYLGSGVAALGDLDGDGYDDVAIGVPGEGRVQLHRGAQTGLETEPWAELNGEPGFGHLLLAAGDVNGDGVPDLAVSVGDGDKLHIFHGTGDGFEAASVLSGSDCFACVQPAALGDVNGDGYDDLAVPSHYADRVSIFQGGPSGLDTTPATVLEGPSADLEYFGLVVLGTGDLTGDGLADLLVSQTLGLDGDVSLYAGAADDQDADGFDTRSDCDDSDDQVHPGATETVGDGVDQDCDGAEICLSDADGDGYSSDVQLTSEDADCTDPGEGLATALDCDDSDPEIHPGASETVGDGVDQDCDGSDAQDSGAPLDTGTDDTGGPGTGRCSHLPASGAAWGLCGLLILAARRRRSGRSPTCS